MMSSQVTLNSAMESIESRDIDFLEGRQLMIYIQNATRAFKTQRNVTLKTKSTFVDTFCNYMTTRLQAEKKQNEDDQIVHYLSAVGEFILSV